MMKVNFRIKAFAVLVQKDKIYFKRIVFLSKTKNAQKTVVYMGMHEYESYWKHNTANF